VPASSTSSGQTNALFSSAPPLPAFLSSCSDQAAASLLTLEEGDVHIWWLRHHVQKNQNQSSPSGNVTNVGSICATILSAEEAAECETSSDPVSKELRQVARAFTRTVLSRYIGSQTLPSSLVFERNQHGKPEIIHPKASLRFNLTHTPGLVGLAVTKRADVGLDAESINRKIKGNALKLAQRRFADLEIEQLERVQGDTNAQAALFIKLWTLKEAYVKAIGKGIGAPPGLRGFSFSLNGPSCELLFDQKMGHHVETNDAREARWHFALMQPLDGYLAAVCCEKNGKDDDVDSNASSELRITSFLADTSSATGSDLMMPHTLATGSSR
jgi:4'-phosphopantetheinyl transferase